METKLQMPVAILALILSVATVAGQAISPATGQPIGQPAPAAPAFDPQTGLPIAQPADADWKDPNWNDPDIVLPDVNFENLPVSEIVSFIREHFKGEFDVITPVGTSAGGTFNGTPVPPTDWGSDTSLQLHLKNVTASELFNAINLVYENDKIPLRWELKMNGHRQLALLRVMVQPNPSASPAAPEVVVRRIYFVGDLVGDEKSGGMSMEQLIKTIHEIWDIADTPSGGVRGSIQFHKEAQLVIISGTPSQVDFVQQTLDALRQKAELARRSNPAAAKSKADEPKK